jgi:hypothetical protein
MHTNETLSLCELIYEGKTLYMNFLHNNADGNAFKDIKMLKYLSTLITEKKINY